MGPTPDSRDCGFDVTSSEKRAFEALCDRRAERARALAERHPEASEVLTFYASLAAFQKQASPDELLTLVAAEGPLVLRRLAMELDAAACLEALEAYDSGADRDSPLSFFGRALLQVRTALAPVEARQSDADCPRCGHRPQVGVLVPEGDGAALILSCSICFGEWRHSRETCPSCRETSAEKLVHYHAPELDHLEVLACDACKIYLNVIRLVRAPDAVPDVDELAALPLDVWAADNGYRKLVRNLAGI